MAYKAPKGTRDVLPEESYRWQRLEALIRGVVAKYGLLEVRTPVIEHTELFLRAIRISIDIVQKEMYTFEDKGGRSITLKPEGTAGVVRLFVEHGLFGDVQPTKLFYLNSPVFRYERPQAGRLREHHQFGVEIFGAPAPSADAECIAIVLEVLDAVGLKGLSVRLNSIGCPHCRPRYHEALRAYLAGRYDELCETCRARYETNPLRILDCKTPSCGEIVAQAPNIMDFLCDDCRAHMDRLLVLLDAMGVRYELTPTLVRGLDYYTRTVFEVFSERIGAQGAICGGGRYDGLVEQLGGPACPGVGFGLGMERLLLLMQQCGTDFESRSGWICSSPPSAARRGPAPSGSRTNCARAGCAWTRITSAAASRRSSSMPAARARAMRSPSAQRSLPQGVQSSRICATGRSARLRSTRRAIHQAI